MKLLIPYRLDINNGYELRYAIRSMVKYFTPLSGVVLIGDKPNWYIGEHIPYPTEPPKERNIYNKLMQVQGIVLYSNDDFFSLQPFDETLPNYYKGLCSDYKTHDKNYKDLYRACPAGWLDFDCHCPMIIDTTKFKWLSADMPIKSVYGNMNKLPGTKFVDLKIRGEWPDLKGRDFFSTHDTADLSRLSELYPEPSRHEAD